MMIKTLLKAFIAVLLAAGMAMHPGCKTTREFFDITGVWRLTINAGEYQFFSTYIFIGNRRLGQIEEYPEDDDATMGSYRVELNQVFITTWSGDERYMDYTDYTGSVISDDSLEGTVAGRSEFEGQITFTWTGNWSATR
jgi:hypothetical protein